jgi:hypothetical protein
MNTLLDVVSDAERAGQQHDGEYHAPTCPECGRGDDRLVVWPQHSDCETGKYWCRRCGASGDGIDYLRGYEGYSWTDACDFFGVDSEAKGDGAARPAPNLPKSSNGTVEPPPPSASSWDEYREPSDTWRRSALQFCQTCRDRLWSDASGAKTARSYLHGRGFSDEVIRTAGIGLNNKDRYVQRTEWGLDPLPDREDGGVIWLPRGVVIPWADSSGLSGVNIRRPNGDIDPDGEPWERRKYQRAAGPSAPLFGRERANGTKPIVLVEGEFDALAVRQAASNLVHAVATGSTGGARRQRWRTLLASAPAVLVAFDAEEPGEDAARTWNRALPNALRWPPHAHDTADMLEGGQDLRIWVRCGLRAAGVPA